MIAVTFTGAVRRSIVLRTALLAGYAVCAATVARPAQGQTSVSGLEITPAHDPSAWLPADATIRLRLSRALLAGEGRLSVWVGTTDVTALLATEPHALIYRPRGVLLPPGESEVAVYRVDAGGAWEEIARFPLRVLTQAGFRAAAARPRLDVGNDGQLAAGWSGAALMPERERYQDFHVSGGLQTEHARGGWSMQTQANLSGVSRQQDALRFQERGEAAPRLDLADYLVQASHEAVDVRIGHIAFGESRHLITAFGARGLSAGVRIGSAASLRMAALNGSSLVGWNNPLGISRPDHRVLGASVALELLPARPGALRVETTGVDGSLLPIAGFTAGAVNDAERSRGGGIRVVASDARQRFLMDAGFARSRFVNPDDPTLSRGAVDIVAVVPAIRNARHLDVTVNVLRDVALTSSLPLAVTAAFRHERVDPLFRSVAATTRADVQQDVVELATTIGALATRVAHTAARDNLTHIPSVLTTRTRSTSVDVALPLAAVAPRAAAWLPSVTWSLAHLHQQGAGIPTDGDFSATHVPDQVSDNHTVSAVWQRARWSGVWTWTSNAQDNRQLGREAADFGALTHTIALTVGAARTLDLGIDAGFEDATNEETARHERARRFGGNAVWRVTSSSLLAARFSSTRRDDTPHSLTDDVREMRFEASQRFRTLGAARGSTPGQLFLRFARFDGMVDASDAERVTRRTWTLSSGLALSLF